MISGLAHVNLLVPPGTLDKAEAFYGGTLGLTPRPVPALQKGMLAWFDIGSSGQQVHVAFDKNDSNAIKSSRHPCFKIESPEALLQLRQKVWEHHERGDESAPQEADRPGDLDSGAKGVEYPSRFFARDYAGNRLEFSL
ncbi:Putative glyoxalase/Bleomycin resistance protein/Dihydroxybiphenyl dioxygenase [Septoria linicola]|uniref:Glyoxalase/Bleomycin resistance protein/Dihydroxybiphenyl dioxygenase n=1 Tax=Septoria linicola TaxID=215465 RepID=A0A9Q9AHG9_9PEZI|nr:putative glyoxalase/Bleomycin resistance protein/Dihydroxybiphenyl dioxygenase [Septoria linicola]USW49282.1 Putative glyoxalase/Bleomycin resistance protein/Dihydroxybiphenyl dioxygenase [Septoria linicola]